MGIRSELLIRAGWGSIGINFNRSDIVCFWEREESKKKCCSNQSYRGVINVSPVVFNGNQSEGSQYSSTGFENLQKKMVAYPAMIIPPDTPVTRAALYVLQYVRKLFYFLSWARLTP